MRRIFAVAALIISSQSFSQDTASKTMDEVTLTASKFSVKTTQTGKVVTIITAQDIEKAGSRDLSQLITEIVCVRYLQCIDRILCCCTDWAACLCI